LIGKLKAVPGVGFRAVFAAGSFTLGTIQWALKIDSD
jgi:hypothetical protein